MFKVNNKNTCAFSDVFAVNFQQVLHLFLAFLLLNLIKQMLSGYISLISQINLGKFAMK